MYRDVLVIALCAGLGVLRSTLLLSPSWHRETATVGAEQARALLCQDDASASGFWPEGSQSAGGVAAHPHPPGQYRPTAGTLR